MRVSEIFGPTIQGEGPSAGRVAMFVRLMGCNLSCSWCDTPYTWDASRYNLAREGHTLSVGDVADEVASTPLVVISGGEPLLQHIEVTALVVVLLGRGQHVEIETNGTQPPLAMQHANLRYNVSPKLAHAGNPYEQRITSNLPLYAGHTFKFVVQSLADLDEIATIVPPGVDVWVMPEGTTVDALNSHSTPELVAAAITRGWNITGRMQVQIWGAERGR